VLPGLCFGGEALDDDVTALAFVEELLQQGGDVLSCDFGDLDLLTSSGLLGEVGGLACLSVGIQEGDPYAEAHAVTGFLRLSLFVEDLRDVDLLILVAVDLTCCDGAEDLIGAGLEVVGLST
jgi:hypothetical protein